MKSDKEEIIVSNCAADAAEGAVPADCRWEPSKVGRVSPETECLRLILQEQTNDARLLRQLLTGAGSEDDLLLKMGEKRNLAAALLRLMRGQGSPEAEALSLMLADDRVKYNDKLFSLRVRLGHDHPVSSVIVRFQHENPGMEALLFDMSRAQDKFIKPGDVEVVRKVPGDVTKHYFTAIVCEGDEIRLADKSNRLRCLCVYSKPHSQTRGSGDWTVRRYIAFDDKRLWARVCATELWFMRNRPDDLCKAALRSWYANTIERRFFRTMAEEVLQAAVSSHSPDVAVSAVGNAVAVAGQGSGQPQNKQSVTGKAKRVA